MEVMPNASPLEPFPNGKPHALAWEQTRKELLNLFVRCYPSRQYGHIDALLPIEDIRSTFRTANDFEMTPLIAHPGQPPEDHKAFKQWKETMAVYEPQQSNLSRAVDRFYHILDLVSLRLVDPDNAGAIFFDPKESFALLDKEYGSLTRNNRITLQAALREKFRPTEQDAHTVLAEHDLIYKRLEKGKAAKQDCDKIDDFLATFQPCGLFERVHEKFLEEYPDSESQKYDDLKKVMLRHLKTHTVGATTGSTGYAGLSERVHQPSSSSDMEARIMANLGAMMEAQQYALLSSIAHGQSAQPPTQPDPWKQGGQNPRNKQRHGPKSTRSARTNPMAKQYCHTHGLVYHNSTECKTPGTQHDITATFDNRKGGSTHNC